jgi:glycosyltransferase involved in cell wall biosynthesis
MDVLVVSAYPSADDPAAYRFVADQVAALVDAGIRPWVVSWDRLILGGGPELRAVQERAIAASRSAAVAPIPRTEPLLPVFQPVDGIRVARLPLPHGPERDGSRTSAADRRAEALLTLASMPDRPRWELVHAHMGYPEGDAAARLATTLRVPLVITEHNRFVADQMAVPEVAQRYRGAAVSAARIIAVGGMLAGELAATLPEAADRIRVIPNTVAVDDFKPFGHEARDPGTLLYVGYRKVSKGIPKLLDAMALVHARRPLLRLRLIGSSSDDAEEQGWRNRIAALGLGDVVRLEPPTDRQGVATAMASATVLVQPSPRETFGMVVTEALACGLPVVAVDSGGVTEIMGPDPARLGALVPNDATALAEAIVATVDRRAELDPGVLRHHVVQRYAGSAVARQIASLYAEVVGGGDRASAGAPDPPRSAAPVQRRPSPEALSAILVAAHRPNLDRLRGAMPPGALDGAEIVTTGPAEPGLVIASVSSSRVVSASRWHAAPSASSPLHRRVASQVLAPMLGRRRRADAAAAVAAIRDAVRHAAVARGGQPVVVCLGGLDALAVEPLVAEGVVRPAPGGVRWLLDAAGGHAPDVRA